MIKNIMIIVATVIITSVITALGMVQFGNSLRYEGKTAREWYQENSHTERARAGCIEGVKKMQSVLEEAMKNEPNIQKQPAQQTVILREQKPVIDDCSDDAAAYNSCLIKYNTDMIEYQSCLMCEQSSGFGCSTSCISPNNVCYTKVSIFCRSKVID